ncbi:HIT family protein [Bacillus sp. JCM 19034]|uniref:HIT family protein n=1 Tax=Bacillus sp. JCM 19034 TaxID=1481928 RepID=UPI0012E1F138|nr:HIT family protein [Bacillus sp. JCM 19034]
MTYEPNCIFCKIVNGEIPSSKVYEDEHVYAFLDISQVTKGHTLVIPKAHYQDIYELPSEVASQLFSAVPKIANGLKAALNPIGMNMINNNGEKAGQTVFHYHIHLIPRYGKGDGYGAVWKDHSSEYSQEELQEAAKAISTFIKN